MRCRQAEAYVSEDLDGLLAPELTSDLRNHLDGCEKCQTYRDDLILGRRLLTATEPSLPDHFEWRLQLKLNQVLQATIAEQHYPWQDRRHDNLSWWRNFSAATAVGLAAVLALAMLIGPFGMGEINGSRLATTSALTGESVLTRNTLDRRPLVRTRGGGLSGFGVQHVAASSDRGTPSWSTRGRLNTSANAGPDDQLTIWRLRSENQRLQQVLLEAQRQNHLLRAKLDTTGSHALNLQHE